MGIFSPYVKWKLTLLLIVLVVLAIGFAFDLSPRPSLLGIGIVGAVVSLAREWAEGWNNTSKKWSLGWLLVGIAMLCMTMLFPDPPQPWVSKVSHLSAASIGMGAAGFVVSTLRGSKA